MKHFFKKYHRHSIRLKGYDYSQEGMYFIKICMHNRLHLFGEIVDHKMILNDAGEIAQNCWLEMPTHYPNVILHEYIIMPNHIHGIIEITKPVGANNHSPNNESTNKNSSKNISFNDDDFQNNSYDRDDFVNRGNYGLCERANDYSPLPRSSSKTIGLIVRGFKIGVTKWFHKNTNIVTLWQRNYYEHIIRNEKSYKNISEYIVTNPINWKDDKFYEK